MSQNPFLYNLPTKKKTSGEKFVSFVQNVIVIPLAILVVLYLFVFVPNQVDGQSMMPNFLNRELLFSNKIVQVFGETEIAQKYNFEYNRGDVIIFQKPGHSDFIKRIVAIPGDTLYIQNGNVFINNIQIKEPYLPEGRTTKTYSFIKDGEKLVIPAGEYFTMGDNRDNSKDSRFSDIGLVKREWIKGRVFIRFWPLDRFGIIERGEVIFIENSQNL